MPPTTQIRIRRDTAAAFTAANPTLAFGEIAYEIDTFRFKVGTGSTAWNSLGYAAQNPTSLTVTDSTPSTSTTTGAVVVTGGVGIGGAVNIGGGATITPNANAPTSNVVLGPSAGAAMQSGAENNVCIGDNAGQSITTQDNCVAIGRLALAANVANQNIAIGSTAMNLANNATATGNVAIGHSALRANLAGAGNVAIGQLALDVNTASDNVAVGINALVNKGSGEDNVAIGSNAGRFRGAGTDTLTSATNSIFIGRSARAADNAQTNQIVIGHNAIGNGSNTTTIGNSSTTGTFIPAGNLTLSNTGSASNTSGLTVTAANGATIRVQADDGSFGDPTIGTYTNKPINIKTNQALRAQFDTSGNFRIQNGNVVLSTAGTGIDFSATTDGSGTMTSELLDDYEEGTWVPSLQFGGASVGMTYGTRLGHYTKVGRLVNVGCYVSLTAKGSSSGTARIAGLPFNVGNNRFAAACVDPGDIAFSGQLSANADINAATLVFLESTTAGVRTTVNQGDFTDTSLFIVSCTYFTE